MPPADGMSGAFFALVLLALVIPIAFFVGRAALREAYRRKAAAHGWSYEPEPGIECAYGLNCPPFGLGRGRAVFDLVTGTAYGVGFRAFRYRADAIGETFAAALALPQPLPEAHLSAAGAVRPGVTGVGVPLGNWEVVAQDAEWAQRVGAQVAPLADRLATASTGITLSLDGAALVVAPLPRDPDALARLLDLAAAVAQAAANLQPAHTPAVPSELGFYNRPGWTYRPRDDAWLDLIPHTGGGSDHEARDVTLIDTGALRLVAFEHHWTTTSTRTVTDANGHSHTETDTHHHQEPIAEIILGFPFGDLSLNWGMFGGVLGGRVRFESDDFNARYRVTGADERFVYDVIHPQQMEWLLSVDAPPFDLESGRMHQSVPDTEPETLEARLAFAYGFFGRVRNYTWENLGLTAPPVARVLSA